MPGSHSIWAAGGSAVLFTAASVVFLTFLAASLSSTTSLRPLRLGLWVAVAFQAAAFVALIFETTVYAWRLENVPPRTRRKAWRDFAAAALANMIAMILPGVVLIITTVDRQQFPPTIIGLRPIVIIGVAFAVWGLSSLLTIGLLVMLGTVTNHVCQSRSVADAGVQTTTRGYVHEKKSRPSSSSHDAVTTPQRPWTPISNKAASSLRSASTKIGTSSVKAKTGRNSVRSSFESPSATLNEGNVFENAFDHYDTSAIHHEMRSTVLLSSPPSRPGLETIPGSRSESQASMNEPQLPSSPLTYNASDPSTPARPSTATSPPSSPPNFSRPTSRHRNQAMSTPPSSVEPMPISAPKAITANLMAALSNPTLPASPTPPPRPRRPSATMNELIHPLFRPSSPEAPPQINTAATMITASPLANKPMTPRTLSRIRSASEVQAANARRTSSTSAAVTATGGWKITPDVSENAMRPRSRSYTSLNSRAASSELQTEGDKPKTPTHAPPPSSFPTALKHNPSSSFSSTKRPSQWEPFTESDIITPVSDTGSLHRSNTKASSIGSPGPSIIEDDVADAHAPILPGFVLSAGSRSSLVGYGKRKSVKRSSAVLL